MPHTYALALCVAFGCCGTALAADTPAVQLTRNGLTYADDARGNRVLDFSYAGYQASESPIPDVPALISVTPSGRDDTRRLQDAIDYVSSRAPSNTGFCGAVLLAPGRFRLQGQLRIRQSGVVLRGSGAGQGGTTLIATGTDRRAAIQIGHEPASPLHDQPAVEVLDQTIEANANEFTVATTDPFQIGDRVVLTHVSTKAWIESLQIDRLGWREGTRDIHWQRKIRRIHGNRLVLDTPITLSVDQETSQLVLYPHSPGGEVQHVGVEDLALESTYDKNSPHDEAHAWFGVDMQNVRDAWLRRLSFRHFAGGAVILGDRTSRITVADCASFQPISELGGYRRHTFFTLGQQCLFLRCWSEQGLHDFSTGHAAAGPNAFVQCYASEALGDSGPIESISMGVLFDNVRIDGHDLNLMNRWNTPNKAGWSVINGVLWQCQAAHVRCERPTVGNNYALGIWATPAGNGHFEGLSDFLKPISLFQQQLRERVGNEAAARIDPLLLKPVGATNPSLEQAQAFTKQSRTPKPQLLDLIRSHWDNAAAQRSAKPGPKSVVDVSDLENTVPPSKPQAPRPKTSPLLVEHGWLVKRGQVLTGKHYTPSWWRGELPPERARAMGRNITRFAPGRSGTGLTDDLQQFAGELLESNYVGYDHHYGLWYDRRRDDHLMVRRRDGQVVPPFYEQPFARSGIGHAWDGLSKYNLTRFNPWYWQRLRDFASLGESHGFAMFHHHYFQHNILEAGAHWADSPWRPANNVNALELPEPPPYVGDKRIFLAKSFYDITQPKLRSLHRQYIRKCLENTAQHSNAIHLTSAEFTGPKSFVEFWLDTVIQWQQGTGNDALIGLSCTKDVQDAILSDPARAEHIDVIDIRYWTYQEDETLYAPSGGANLAPRQHVRQLKPKSTSFRSIATSVSEYRTRFPDKAVTYYSNIYCRAKREGWAILMGGGSMANVPKLPASLSRALVRMKPAIAPKSLSQALCLADNMGNQLLYGLDSEPQTVLLRPDQEAIQINRTSGQLQGEWLRQRVTLAQDQIVWVRQSDTSSDDAPH